MVPGLFREVTVLLVARENGTVVTRVTLAGRRRITVGRSPRCDLRLDAASVSRRHALLFRHEGGWHAVDLGSRTGTWWGEASRRHGTLAADAWVRIGPAYLWLRDGRTAGSADGLPRVFVDPIEFDPSLLLPGEPDPAPAEAPPAGPMLAIAAPGGATLRRLELRGCDLVTVGRSRRCDVTLNDPRVSRLHCVLFTEHRGWYVADVGSTSGTRVDGGRATWRRRLRPGRLFRVGDTLLWLEQSAAEAPANAEAPLR